MDANLSELRRRAESGDSEARRQYNIASVRSGHKLRIPKNPKGYFIMAYTEDEFCSNPHCSLCAFIPAASPKFHVVVRYSWNKDTIKCPHKHATKRAARECARRHAYSEEMKRLFNG